MLFAVCCVLCGAVCVLCGVVCCSLSDVCCLFVVCGLCVVV